MPFPVNKFDLASAYFLWLSSALAIFQLHLGTLKDGL